MNIIVQWHFHVNICLLHNIIIFIDNGIYDAGTFEDYPAEGYHDPPLPPPLPKVQLTSDKAYLPSSKVQSASDRASIKGMWFESLYNAIIATYMYDF